MPRKKRKNYSSKEKVSILRQHLVDGTPVSDLCDQHGIHPTLFYHWLGAPGKKNSLTMVKQLLKKSQKPNSIIWSVGFLP